MIECDNCGRLFDPIARRWLCPCGMKANCCEGAPLDGDASSAANLGQEDRKNSSGTT